MANPSLVMRRAKRVLHARQVRDLIPRVPAGGLTDGIPNRLLGEKRRELDRRRTFGPPDLEALIRLVDRADEVVTLREAHARGGDRPGRFIALRHDMDHDLENAVRFAEWEAANGLRATYFVLHTDWYYRHADDPRPSKFVLTALDRIASLGHEIAVHNNAITAALLTGQDAVVILEREIELLREAGYEITGTVAHGDPLCRTVGYVNYEIFTECPRPDLGGPKRTLEYIDPATHVKYSTQLRPVSMRKLGLEYEANRVASIVSDTGGRWSQAFEDVEARFASEGGFIELLVHPVWWALSGEPFRPRSDASRV